MRVLGSWPPLREWPGPSPTSLELFHDRQYTQVFCFHIRHTNVNRSLQNAVHNCWFICRFGMQNYSEVITWPQSQVNQAMESLGFWIEKEGPKTKSGPS